MLLKELFLVVLLRIEESFYLIFLKNCFDMCVDCLLFLMLFFFLSCLLKFLICLLNFLIIVYILFFLKWIDKIVVFLWIVDIKMCNILLYWMVKII